MKNVKDRDIDNAMKHLLKTRCTEEKFEIGDQKSIDILRILKTVGNGNLKIVSEMNQELLQNIFRLDPLKSPNESPQKALRRALEEYVTTRKVNPLVYLIRDPGILTLEK